jgi:hypothetical protein
MEKPQSRSIYRFRGKLRWITFVVICLVLVSTIPSPSFSWSNGGFSSNPSNPKYGTHDWIAEHALDWLPLEVKQWLLPYKALYLYGTELPDNGQAPDGIGDTQLHHIYFYADGRLMDDSAAVRANATYRQALSYMLKGDFSSAAKYAGAMTHYISDMAVFGHVMGKYTPWGEEKHHSDYEDYVNSRTSSYYAEFNVYLKFDGKLDILTAYNAAIKLAYDTTFDSSGRGLTCVWMDQNYDWSNPTFKNRAGESINLAVNLIADTLYTLYMEYKASTAAITGVEGYVKDEAGKPISGVKVAVLSKTIGRVCEAKTDDAGHYFMEIPPGEYVLVFSAIGYADGSVNVSLSSGEVKRVDYTLKSAVAEFLEDWGGVKFEVALMGNLTWEVCSNATIKVSVTVHDMGGNVEVEFKQLKLYLIDGAVSQTVPINARLSVGGLAFTREASLTILYGFSYLAPGTSETKQLRISLEGSYVDKYGASWPKLSEENVNVKVYAPQTPISITIDAPETIHVGEEFTIKVKLKNEGKYQIRDVELELETPTATSLLSPRTTGINMLNPGGEFTATFKLRAEGAATSQIYISYITFRTLWDYHVWQPHMNLGSIVISKVPTSISITVEPRQVTVGESVNVKGAITPAMNTQITLTVKEPDGSTKTFSTTSYLDGTFTFTVKLDKEGKYTFTASFQGDAKYEASRSSEVYVEVKPAPPPLWLYAIVAICIITIIAIIVIKLRR